METIRPKPAKKMIEAAALLLLAAIFIFPLAWMISTSFKTIQETAHFPPTMLPQEAQFDNYAEAYIRGNFSLAAINSVIIAVGVLIVQLLVVLPAAYAFAFKATKLHKVLFGLVIIGLMVPQQVAFLPVHLLFARLGIINTYIPLIIPFASSAFGIFMITQAFKQIPKDVVEAAKLDKASNVKTIWRVLLPSIRPTIISFMLFSFISHWNDYFWPFAMSNTDSLRTLPIAVARLSGVDTVKHWGVIMAGNMIFIAPLLVIYVFCNKWIKKAFTYSGVK